MTSEETVQAATELTTEVRQINASVEVLRQYKHHTRQLAWAALTVTIISLGVLAWSVSLAVGGHDLAAKVSKTQESQYKSCQDQNKARAGSRQLWEFIYNADKAQLASPAVASKLTPQEMSQQKQLLESFRQKYTQVYAPIDCSKLPH